MVIRNIQPADHAPIIASVDAWWGGRPMAGMLPQLFFAHFCDTSFVAQEDEKLIGFLIGFLSQSQPDEAYCHFIGADPAHRRSGLGRSLYESFFRVAAKHQRYVVHAVTSPLNRGSIAFHQRLGFTVVPGTAEHEGTSVHPGYDGPGQDRVLFSRTNRK
jgi:GNAT superfamily N-acetyltransferase